MWKITLVVIFVPILLMAATALVQQPNRFQFMLSTMVFALAIFFMWLAFPWFFVSTWLKLLIPILFLAAVWIGYRRIGPPKKPRGKVLVGIVTYWII